MAENEVENKQNGKVRKAPLAKKKKLLIVSGLAILILFVGIVGAARLGLAEGYLGLIWEEEVEEESNEPAFTLSVPEILVNLPQDGGRERYLSVKFYLGYDAPALGEEMEKRMPEIRDAALKVLWEKTEQDVNSPEDKERLRQELFEAINDLLGSDQLQGVYFWHVMTQ